MSTGNYEKKVTIQLNLNLLKQCTKIFMVRTCPPPQAVGDSVVIISFWTCSALQAAACVR